MSNLNKIFRGLLITFAIVLFTVFSYVKFYTAQISFLNVGENFNFKESKLNEFRNVLVETSDLDFDKLNKYAKDKYNKKIDNGSVFFNKIDDNRYETIRIENNNCYYKLIYNPKL